MTTLFEMLTSIRDAILTNHTNDTKSEAIASVDSNGLYLAIVNRIPASSFCQLNKFNDSGKIVNLCNESEGDMKISNIWNHSSNLPVDISEECMGGPQLFAKCVLESAKVCPNGNVFGNNTLDYVNASAYANATVGKDCSSGSDIELCLN